MSFLQCTIINLFLLICSLTMVGQWGKKKIFIFFILSVLIGFIHGSLEFFALCLRIIGFFLLYLIRLKWNENSKFWYIVNSKYTKVTEVTA